MKIRNNGKLSLKTRSNGFDYYCVSALAKWGSPIILIALVGMQPTSIEGATPPGGVAIKNVSYQGEGCQPNSVSTNIAADLQSLTLAFSDFAVESTGQRAQTACRVAVDIAVPPGWQMTLFCADFRGYGNLDSGLTGMQTAAFSVGRSGPVTLASYSMNGPFDDDYQHLGEIPKDQSMWTNCGGRRLGHNRVETINIDTTLEVSANSRQQFDRRQVSQAISSLEKRVWRAKIELIRPLGVRSEEMQELRSILLRLHRLGTKVQRGLNQRHTADEFRSIKQSLRGVQRLIARTHLSPTELRNIVGPIMDGVRELSNLLRPIATAAGDAQGFLTLDSLDQELKHHYGIAWRRCPTNDWRSRWRHRR